MPSNEDDTLGTLTKESRLSPAFRTISYSDNLNFCFKNAKNATYAWVIFVAIYWTALAIVPCIFNNNLATHQFFFWMCGGIATCSVYYSVKADKPADSPAGKPLLALTCLLMFSDWATSAFLALGTGDFGLADGLLMLFHGLAVLWATLFFYNRAIKNAKKLAWITLILEWLDIVFMCIVILLLHSELGHCLTRGICLGYCIALLVQMFGWFFPILFGYSDTERFLHIHMVLVDTFTDLPLVAIIALTGAYKIHPFIFLDVAFKLILLLRSYSYHLVYNVCLRSKELKLLQLHQEEEIAMELQMLDDGAADEDIHRKMDEMIVRHQTEYEDEKKAWMQEKDGGIR